MEKTLVSVLLPATGREYDFWVPDDMLLKEVTVLIAEAMQVAEPSFYRRSSNAALMHNVTGAMLPPNVTVSEFGLTDGDRLSLV